jgi:hypothetical protein
MNTSANTTDLLERYLQAIGEYLPSATLGSSPTQNLSTPRTR